MEILLMIVGFFTVCAGGGMLHQSFEVFSNMAKNADGWIYFLFGLIFLIFSLCSIFCGHVMMNNASGILSLLQG